MQQAIDQLSIGEWNRFRPAAAPLAPSLTRRAQTVYGWIAGFYAFAVPWSDLVLLPYKVQFTRPLVALAVLSWLFSWRADNTVKRLPLAVSLMLLFVVLVPAHLLTSMYPIRTGRRLMSYVGLFLVVLFFQQTIRTWEMYRSVLRGFVAGSTIPLAGLAWNVINGVAMGDGRYSAPKFDPNDLAGQVALSIPIASYLAFNVGKGAVLYWLYLPAAVAGILLTASRAGLVAMLLAAVYPALCLLRRTRRGKVGILAAVLCTGFAIYFLAPNISFDRLATLGDQIERGDMNGRGAIWRNGMRLFYEHPVVGIGAGTFADAVSDNTAAHNSYLEVLVEHGIIGLAIFLGIIAALFGRTRQFPPDERLLWRVILGSWMVLVVTLSWENREVTWLLWGMCCSLVVRPPAAAPGEVRGLAA